MKRHALPYILAGCLLWLLLLPVCIGKLGSSCAGVLVSSQALLDKGLADDQPDFTTPERVFTRTNDRNEFLANIAGGNFDVTFTVRLASSAEIRRLNQSERFSDQSDFLLRGTRGPRAPPA